MFVLIPKSSLKFGMPYMNGQLAHFQPQLVLVRERHRLEFRQRCCRVQVMEQRRRDFLDGGAFPAHAGGRALEQVDRLAGLAEQRMETLVRNVLWKRRRVVVLLGALYRDAVLQLLFEGSAGLRLGHSAAMLGAGILCHLAVVIFSGETKYCES